MHPRSSLLSLSVTNAPRGSSSDASHGPRDGSGVRLTADSSEERASRSRNCFSESVSTAPESGTNLRKLTQNPSEIQQSMRRRRDNGPLYRHQTLINAGDRGKNVPGLRLTLCGHLAQDRGAG